MTNPPLSLKESDLTTARQLMCELRSMVDLATGVAGDDAMDNETVDQLYRRVKVLKVLLGQVAYVAYLGHRRLDGADTLFSASDWGGPVSSHTPV